MSPPTFHQCVKHLEKTERGRSAMRHILAWMDDAGLGLDTVNKEACITLIEGCWRSPGTARDMMRNAINEKVSL
mgnify:CR=1 FL=1